MSVGGFPDGQFVEAISQAVQRIKPVELGVLLGKILGGKILFPSEVEAVELKVLESKICIQRAVDSWETGSKTALNEAFKALDKADEALKCAWIVVVKTFILYIGISLILTAIFVSLVRRCSRSLQQHNSYNVQ